MTFFTSSDFLSFPLLQANLESDQPHVRGTVITALKYTISDQPQEVDTQLSKYIGDFMVAISDPDLVSQGNMQLTK